MKKIETILIKLRNKISKAKRGHAASFFNFKAYVWLYTKHNKDNNNDDNDGDEGNDDDGDSDDDGDDDNSDNDIGYNNTFIIMWWGEVEEVKVQCNLWVTRQKKKKKPQKTNNNNKKKKKKKKKQKQL